MRCKEQDHASVEKRQCCQMVSYKTDQAMPREMTSTTYRMQAIVPQHVQSANLTPNFSIGKLFWKN